jgi:ubiquinone biosynthesis protein
MDFGKVGYLSDRDRRDLTQLFILAMTQDTEGIVDQLIRMGASSDEVDAKGLAQDIGRVLIEYQNLPLKDIHVGEALHDVLPVTDRHDLRMPANLWATVNMLAMAEGVVLKLDPDFDVFGFCEPYVRKMSLRLALPRGNWAYELLRQGTEWSDLLHNLPRTGNRLLERAERGQPFQIGLRDAESIMRQMDRLTTRMALALLLAALTISLALLGALGGEVLKTPVTAGYVVAIALTAWLFISILRGTR